MKFTIYSKDGCPYCTKVQQVLDLSELKYVVYKLDKDFNREQFFEEFGSGSTFPQVVVNHTSDGLSEYLGGCTETIQFLKEEKIL